MTLGNEHSISIFNEFEGRKSTMADREGRTTCDLSHKDGPWMLSSGLDVKIKKIRVIPQAFLAPKVLHDEV